MDLLFFAKILILWTVLAASAIATGAVREMLIRPRVGEQAAHVAGTLLFVGVLFLVVLGGVAWFGEGPARHFWAVGGAWLAMTIAFEFLFMHYMRGISWEKLLADYNIFAGRLWILVLGATLVSPWLCAHLRGLITPG